ncbi:hypothetical protein VIBNISOn1_1050002 [Vibrio nigripulchritudo SOn1]|uniref:Putative exodeoxyribonuclease 8 PDDEXK-like domain-containing protein n=1 Tax=Vibrio nigripulchritudo SOn1 TaxID=1238450 RepID=A0AAV2VI11_9VIBR|nr:PD-(D/E)XK nuclease-like domain-containing protein [Vibrio nigripulchritudo]CCO44176.1 hypothetical protein VIBNISOn1_1050002 [Vibrio nigripulchritudo SOn1]
MTNKNQCINRSTAASLQTSLGVKPIVSTPTGFLAQMSDRNYRNISAHSKSSIAPALRSGTDYEFFTVEKRGKKKQTQGMVDGKILHCLLLEEASFNQQYTVQENFDEVHKQNPLYFESHDALRAFVTAHNKKNAALKKACVTAIKAYNAELKQEVATIESYEALPAEYRKAVPSKAALKRLSERFLNEFLVDIPKDAIESVQKERVAHLLKTFNTEIEGALSSKEAFLKSKTSAKVEFLNVVIPSLRVAWEQLSDEGKIARFPEDWVVDALTKKSKEDAIKAFNKTERQCRSDLYLDDKATTKQMYTQCIENGQSEALAEYKDCCPQVLTKMFNIGGKKSETEEYSATEVLQQIKDIYGGAPILKTFLVEEEEERAARENKELISQDIYDHARRVVDATLAHEKAGPILRQPGNMYEVAMVWNDWLEADWFAETEDAETQALDGDLTKRQILWKGKLDVLNLEMNFIADVKFMSTVEFDALERDASKFTYHLQDAIYTQGFNEIMSSLPSGAQELTKFVFVFIEKDAQKLGDEEAKPVRVRVLSFKRHHIERATRLAKQSALLAELWESSGVYDGFDAVEEIDVPLYQVRAEERWLAQTEERLQSLAQKRSSDNPSTMPVNEEFQMPEFNSLKAG